ncbi:MAG TPA: DUF885 family protein, partial [Clostridia bacterium]|nr:DUF885 family protein [Clostridia bacterium]
MDTRLEAYFREYLEAWFRQQPLAATQLGDHRFDDRLDDVSPRARREWIALSRQTLEGLPRRVKFEELSRPGQVDYDILQQHLKRSLWLEENIRRFETDPRVYNEYISDAVFLLLSQSSLPKEQNLANCLARMEQIPQVAAAAKLSLTNPPRAALETAIRQNEGSIGFYEKDIFELAGKTPRLQELKTSAARVVSTLKEYGKYLKEDLLPRAHGEWRLGRETFSQKLELELDAGLSADQVLAEAEAEFDRVSREMQVIARQLWSSYYPKMPVPADDAVGRREMVARVLERIGQDHCKPQKLVSEVRDTVAAVKDFIRAHEILTLPSPDSCR